jgi:VIT1/CCC1 family predicted Fe2+/Mn2+ transporter
MAAGEFVSMSAQKELLERELQVERDSLAKNPQAEQKELAAIYRGRGLDHGVAEQVSSELMERPEVALEVHAREELGVDPTELGSPYAAAFSSLLAFTLGALVPLVPWFVTEGSTAVAASITLGSVAALLIGAAVGISTGRGPWLSALRQLAIGALAGAVTYGIGYFLGVQVA